ncbi:DUF4230 domain-containing protein [Lewinella cohaerens]|uniref:DUF4230 domain-containing protein n=1 Tax=Lewinella cohaerens TaxID=70995 RepID=UPI00035D1A0D|nr:DUF4230 domain-containing protein [Lewinella cohaerens]
MRSKLGLGVLLALVFLAGLWMSYQWFNSRPRESQQVESTVLLERVREVCQLVTVEGQFTELYTETNLKEVTLYLPIPTYWEFSKQALLEVKGRVLVGYDMEQVSIKVDSTAGQIVLSNLPEPSILAIDHEISYRNLEESFFNSFTPEDYTQLNRNAKEVLRRKAEESDLLDKAREEGNAMLDAITFMAKSIGWEVIYEKPTGKLPAPKMAN